MTNLDIKVVKPLGRPSGLENPTLELGSCSLWSTDLLTHSYHTVTRKGTIRMLTREPTVIKLRLVLKGSNPGKQ